MRTKIKKHYLLRVNPTSSYWAEIIIKCVYIRIFVLRLFGCFYTDITMSQDRRVRP